MKREDAELSPAFGPALRALLPRDIQDHGCGLQKGLLQLSQDKSRPLSSSRQYSHSTCSTVLPLSFPYSSIEAADPLAQIFITPKDSISSFFAQTLLKNLRPNLGAKLPLLSRMAVVTLLFFAAASAFMPSVTALESEDLVGMGNHKLDDRGRLNFGTKKDKNVDSINSNNNFGRKNKFLDMHNTKGRVIQGFPLDGQAAQADHKQADDPLRQLALEQKQKAADAAAVETQRKEQIQQQIEDHEKRYAAKQQQMEQKEQLRKERERILAENHNSEAFKETGRDKGPQYQKSKYKEIPAVNQQQKDLIEQHRREAQIDKNRDNLNVPNKQSYAAVGQQAFVKSQDVFGAGAPAQGKFDNKGDHQAPLRPPKKQVFDESLPQEPKKNGFQDSNKRDSEDNIPNVGIHFRATTRGTNSVEENLPSNESNNGNSGGNVQQEAALPKENNLLGIPIEHQPKAIKAITAGNLNPNEEGSNNFNGGAGGLVQNHDNNVNSADSYKEPQQFHQPDQSQAGGMNLAWDWEDFSITFNNYGAAELKVRRSPHATTGEPWPMPQYYSKKDHKVYRISRDLKLIPTKVTCDILEEGLSRHLQRILRGAVEDMYDNLQNAEGTFVDDPAPKYQKDEFVKAPFITKVEIRVRNSCSKFPTLESDETYDLVVKKKKTYVWANEVWGALRGLETLGQLVWRGTDGHLYIKETVVSDYPRFPHRGLHIDTSRHFLFKEILLDIIDSMEMNKLNVFHWHIVDDQSFPYESKVYPELSRKGAYHPTYVYTLEDIAEIIEYARFRGVRVMPEFDTPGHTYSWGLSRPELLTQCYSMDRVVKGYLGPIDPSKNATYRFLEALFQEIVEVFQDQYLHLGGDEVPLGCWQSNPEVMAFANNLAKQTRVTSAQTAQAYNNNYAFSMWSDDIKRVYEYYENRLINIISDIAKKKKKNIKYVMWQEVMNNNLQLPNDTIIQVWMGDMADVSRAISLGYQVLYSTCWYLDHIEYGTKWPKYYQCDPADNSYGYHIDESKVLGGEIAFWSEYFSNENLIPLMWPRASAGAERLWSNKEVKNLDRAAERLSEHRCRMIKRGINAGEISGPGYCLHAPPKRRVYNDTAGCKGSNCTGRSHNIVQIEDIELHLRQRGGSIADCGSMFSRGNTGVLILLLIVLILVVGGAGACTLSRSPSRLHRSRLCRNRSVLFVFVGVLMVYFLCYTTIWMRAFEFSGSFHKTFQEDRGGGGDQVQNNLGNA